jgi:hypothetical protein
LEIKKYSCRIAFEWRFEEIAVKKAAIADIIQNDLTEGTIVCYKTTGWYL